MDGNGANTISLSGFCDYYLVDRIEYYLPSYLASKKEFLRNLWHQRPVCLLRFPATALGSQRRSSPSLVSLIVPSGAECFCGRSASRRFFVLARPQRDSLIIFNIVRKGAMPNWHPRGEP